MTVAMWVQLTGMMMILFGLPTLLMSFMEEIKRDKPLWRPAGLALIVVGGALVAFGMWLAPETF